MKSPLNRESDRRGKMPLLRVRFVDNVCWGYRGEAKLLCFIALNLDNN